MKFNDFAAWILRSPFYWMMGPGTLLISVTGRRSGRPVTLPVNYHRLDDEIWITSRRSRVWWRNLEAHPQARVWLGGRSQAVHGRLVTDEKAVAEGLTRLFTAAPLLARALGLHLEHGMPRPAELGRAAADRLLIKLTLD